MGTQQNPQHQTAAAMNKLYITAEARQVQDRIVAVCDKEVGWVGIVRQYGAALVVEKILIPRQEVSGTSVDVEPEDFGIAELMEEHPDDVAFMRYFGHSHVNMSAYFSGTDTGQIDDWRKYGLTWCINHVQNKNGASKTRFDMFDPFHLAIDIPTVVTLVPESVETWVQDELKEKVKARRVTTMPSARSSSGWNGHSQSSNQGMVGARQGHYTTVVDGWRRTYVSHKLTRAEELRTGKVELYEHGKLKSTYNKHEDPEAYKKDLADRESRSTARSDSKRAEGKGQSPATSGGARQPQIQTANGAANGQNALPNVTQSGPNSARVQALLSSGEVLTEAEASAAQTEDDDAVYDQFQADMVAAGQVPEDFELELLSLGLGYRAHHYAGE